MIEFVPFDESNGFPDDLTRWDEPEYKGTQERHVFYPDPCEQCGGNQWDIGGHSHFNGNYQCYTLYLECENCGIYEVECV